jgi:hypothetical protein
MPIRPNPGRIVMLKAVDAEPAGKNSNSTFFA